jgi:hypothetical protein
LELFISELAGIEKTKRSVMSKPHVNNFSFMMHLYY